MRRAKVLPIEIEGDGVLAGDAPAAQSAPSKQRASTAWRDNGSGTLSMAASDGQHGAAAAFLASPEALKGRRKQQPQTAGEEGGIMATCGALASLDGGWVDQAKKSAAGKLLTTTQMALSDTRSRLIQHLVQVIIFFFDIASDAALLVELWTKGYVWWFVAVLTIDLFHFGFTYCLLLANYDKITAWTIPSVFASAAGKTQQTEVQLIALEQLHQMLVFVYQTFNTFCFCLFCIFGLPGTVLLDLFMVFIPLIREASLVIDPKVATEQGAVQDKVMNFLFQYAKVRLPIECFLGAVPQTIAQTLLFFTIFSGSGSSGLTALLPSMVASFLNVIKNAWDIRSSWKQSRESFGEYLSALFRFEGMVVVPEDVKNHYKAKAYDHIKQYMGEKATTDRPQLVPMQVNEGDEVIKPLGNTQRRVALSWVGAECMRSVHRIEADAFNPWPKTLVYQVRALHLADMSLRTATRFFDEVEGMPMHVRVTLTEVSGSGRLTVKKARQCFSELLESWLKRTALQVRPRQLQTGDGSAHAADTEERPPLTQEDGDDEDGQEEEQAEQKPDLSGEHGLEELWIEGLSGSLDVTSLGSLLPEIKVMVLDGSPDQALEIELESLWEEFQEACWDISLSLEDEAEVLYASFTLAGKPRRWRRLERKLAARGLARNRGWLGSKQAPRAVAESTVHKAAVDIEAAAAAAPRAVPVDTTGAPLGRSAHRSIDGAGGGGASGEGAEHHHRSLLVCSWQASSQLEMLRAWEQRRKQREREMDRLPGGFRLAEVHMVSGLPHVPLYNVNWTREQLLVCPRPQHKMVWEAVVGLLCPRLEVQQLLLDGDMAGRPRMSDWDMLAVSAGIARCTTLKELVLRRHSITPHPSVTWLVNALDFNTSLHSSLVRLDLSHNFLGDAGVKLLVSLLARLSALRHLALDSVNMGRDSAEELSGQVLQLDLHRKLETLSLKGHRALFGLADAPLTQWLCFYMGGRNVLDQCTVDDEQVMLPKPKDMSKSIVEAIDQVTQQKEQLEAAAVAEKLERESKGGQEGAAEQEMALQRGVIVSIVEGSDQAEGRAKEEGAAAAKHRRRTAAEEDKGEDTAGDAAPPDIDFLIKYAVVVKDIEQGKYGVAVLDSTTSKAGGGLLCEGDKVEGDYRGKGRWYPGRLTRDRGDGTYDIDYDDGERELRVKDDCIRLVGRGRGTSSVSSTHSRMHLRLLPDDESRLMFPFNDKPNHLYLRLASRTELMPQPMSLDLAGALAEKLQTLGVLDLTGARLDSKAISRLADALELNQELAGGLHTLHLSASLALNVPPEAPVVASGPSNVMGFPTAASSTPAPSLSPLVPSPDAVATWRALERLMDAVPALHVLHLGGCGIGDEELLGRLLPAVAGKLEGLQLLTLTLSNVAVACLDALTKAASGAESAGARTASTSGAAAVKTAVSGLPGSGSASAAVSWRAMGQIWAQIAEDPTRMQGCNVFLPLPPVEGSNATEAAAATAAATSGSTANPTGAAATATGVVGAPSEAQASADASFAGLQLRRLLETLLPTAHKEPGAQTAGSTRAPSAEADDYASMPSTPGHHGVGGAAGLAPGGLTRLGRDPLAPAEPANVLLSSDVDPLNKTIAGLINWAKGEAARMRREAEVAKAAASAGEGASKAKMAHDKLRRAVKGVLKFKSLGKLLGKTKSGADTVGDEGSDMDSKAGSVVAPPGSSLAQVLSSRLSKGMKKGEETEEEGDGAESGWRTSRNKVKQAGRRRGGVLKSDCDEDQAVSDSEDDEDSGRRVRGEALDGRSEAGDGKSEAGDAAEEGHEGKEEEEEEEEDLLALLCAEELPRQTMHIKLAGQSLTWQHVVALGLTLAQAAHIIRRVAVPTGTDSTLKASSASAGAAGAASAPAAIASVVSRMPQLSLDLSHNAAAAFNPTAVELLCWGLREMADAGVHLAEIKLCHCGLTDKDIPSIQALLGVMAVGLELGHQEVQAKDVQEGKAPRANGQEEGPDGDRLPLSGDAGGGESVRGIPLLSPPLLPDSPRPSSPMPAATMLPDAADAARAAPEGSPAHGPPSATMAPGYHVPSMSSATMAPGYHVPSMSSAAMARSVARMAAVFGARALAFVRSPSRRLLLQGSSLSWMGMSSLLASLPSGIHVEVQVPVKVGDESDNATDSDALKDMTAALPVNDQLEAAAWFTCLDAKLKKERLRFQELFNRYDQSGMGNLDYSMLASLLSDVQRSRSAQPLAASTVVFFLTQLDPDELGHITYEKLLQMAKDMMRLGAKLPAPLPAVNETAPDAVRVDETTGAKLADAAEGLLGSLFGNDATSICQARMPGVGQLLVSCCNGRVNSIIDQLRTEAQTLVDGAVWGMAAAAARVARKPYAKELNRRALQCQRSYRIALGERGKAWGHQGHGEDAAFEVERLESVGDAACLSIALRQHARAYAFSCMAGEVVKCVREVAQMKEQGQGDARSKPARPQPPVASVGPRPHVLKVKVASSPHLVASGAFKVLSSCLAALQPTLNSLSPALLSQGTVAGPLGSRGAGVAGSAAAPVALPIPPPSVLELHLVLKGCGLGSEKAAEGLALLGRSCRGVVRSLDVSYNACQSPAVVTAVFRALAEFEAPKYHDTTAALPADHARMTGGPGVSSLVLSGMRLCDTFGLSRQLVANADQAAEAAAADGAGAAAAAGAEGAVVRSASSPPLQSLVQGLPASATAVTAKGGQSDAETLAAARSAFVACIRRLLQPPPPACDQELPPQLQWTLLCTSSSRPPSTPPASGNAAELVAAAAAAAGSGTGAGPTTAGSNEADSSSAAACVEVAGPTLTQLVLEQPLADMLIQELSPGADSSTSSPDPAAAAAASEGDSSLSPFALAAALAAALKPHKPVQVLQSTGELHRMLTSLSLYAGDELDLSVFAPVVDDNKTGDAKLQMQKDRDAALEKLMSVKLSDLDVRLVPFTDEPKPPVLVLVEELHSVATGLVAAATPGVVLSYDARIARTEGPRRLEALLEKLKPFSVDPQWGVQIAGVFKILEVTSISSLLSDGTRLKELCTALQAIKGTNSSQAEFKEGDVVEGNYRGRGKWFKGKVSRVSDGELYDILYDDGDRENGVRAEYVRVIGGGGQAAVAENKPVIGYDVLVTAHGVSLNAPGDCTSCSPAEAVKLMAWLKREGASCIAGSFRQSHVVKSRDSVCVAVSSDGKLGVTGDRLGDVYVWDMATGQGRKLNKGRGHTDLVKAVAVSPSNASVITAGEDNTARLWDLESGACLKVLSGHTAWVNDVVFTPDGMRALTASADRSIRVWDLATGECTSTLMGHTDRVTNVAVTRDGKTVVSCSHDYSICSWDLAEGKAIKKFDVADEHGNRLEPPKALALLETNGSQPPLAVTCGGGAGIQFWDLQQGKRTMSIPLRDSGASGLALTQVGRMLLAACNSGQVKVFDVRTGSLVKAMAGHETHATAVAVSPDGGTALSIAHDDTLRMWKLWSSELPTTTATPAAGGGPA